MSCNFENSCMPGTMRLRAASSNNDSLSNKGNKSQWHLNNGVPTLGYNEMTEYIPKGPDTSYMTAEIPGVSDAMVSNQVGSMGLDNNGGMANGVINGTARGAANGASNTAPMSSASGNTASTGLTIGTENFGPGSTGSPFPATPGAPGSPGVGPVPEGVLPEQINLEVPANPLLPPGYNEFISYDNLQYLNGFLRTQIGKYMRVEHLIGSNNIEDRFGFLVGVGINYIVLQELATGNISALDYYNIKYVYVYHSVPDLPTK